MDFSGRGFAVAAAVAACLAAEPASAFIAPALAGRTATNNGAITMVAASPTQTFTTTKSDATFAEAKVRMCFVGFHSS